MLNEGNQIHNVISSSGSGTVINYGSGSDFLTSYGSGSGSTSQKVPVPLVRKFRFRFHNAAVRYWNKGTLECYGTRLRCWMPEYWCRWHRLWCRCPAMNCTHSKWKTYLYGLLLLLLTLQHHYIKSTNNYVNFDHMFAPILMVLPCQLHQYIGATDMVVPLYCWNCANSSTNTWEITNIC